VLGLIDYGQLIKIKAQGWVVGKEKTVVYGEPSLGDIETRDVESLRVLTK